MTAALGGADLDRVRVAQATGMLMQQHGLDERRAVALLMETAQEGDLRLADAARKLVENWP